MAPDAQKSISVPDKGVLQKQYAFYYPELETLLKKLVSELRARLDSRIRPTYKARVKDFESYYRKLLRISLSCPAAPEQGAAFFPVISDIIGIRIVCAFLQDLKTVEDILRSSFEILEVERKGADRTFREFGYESTHILISIPPELKEGLSLPDSLVFEVQLRTILQDAWAEVEHELVYKSEFSPFDLPLKRKLASINASLSLADIIFQELRDYQTKLNREIETRRMSFYTQVDAAAKSPDAGAAVDSQAAGDLDGGRDLPYLQGTIDDMILGAIEAHNAGHIDKAVKIYSAIIASGPPPIALSVIYKHRGMAHFARSDYDSALADFQESVSTNPEDFRAYYYIGIVLSILRRNSEAEEAFNKSLALNMYQPYLYLRRARCFYNMGRYHDALEDLDKACALGLDVPEEKALRIKIAENMDTV